MMTLNKFIKLLLIGIVATSCSSKKKEINSEKPNVLFIAVDDLNDWIGCMGGNKQVKTPNIDKLAQNGVLFTNAHCQAPICSPSRASVMTGLYPTSTGVYMLTPSHLQDIETTRNKVFLPHHFAQNGYHTLGKGKILHSYWDSLFIENGGQMDAGPFHDKEDKLSFPLKSKYHDWGAFPAHDSLLPDYKTTQWAIKQLQRQHDKPFFLAVGFHRPHLPMYVPQKWLDMYPIESIHLPDIPANDLDDISKHALEITEKSSLSHQWMVENNQWKHATQCYLACVSFVDFYVGQIIDALENSEYADNTVIVLWSDHGWHLGEKQRWAKRSLWEESTKVPLIFAGKGVPKGVKCNKQVELIDIYPTLNELCELPQKSDIDGNSLLPLFKKPNSLWNLPAITNYGKRNYAICQNNWKLIVYNNDDKELYKLETDPNEWENLAKNEKYSGIIDELMLFLPQNPAERIKHNPDIENPLLFD